MALLRIRKPDGEIVEIACLPGQGVPEVTVDDDGKTLLVVDGEWAAAALPMATRKELGAVSVMPQTAAQTTGISINDNGIINIVAASESYIDERENAYLPITPKYLEYAVKSVGDGYYATVEDVGNIEAALDSILAMQETLIGGDSV